MRKSPPRWLVVSVGVWLAISVWCVVILFLLPGRSDAAATPRKPWVPLPGATAKLSNIDQFVFVNRIALSAYMRAEQEADTDSQMKILNAFPYIIVAGNQTVKIIATDSIACQIETSNGQRGWRECYRLRQP